MRVCARACVRVREKFFSEIVTALNTHRLQIVCATLHNLLDFGAMSHCAAVAEAQNLRSTVVEVRVHVRETFSYVLHTRVLTV